MATYAVCRNGACSENGVEKIMEVALHPDEQVGCGECHEACELTGDEPRRIEPPA